MIEAGESSALLSSVIGSLPLPAFPGMTTPADKYIAILQSRRVLDAVIEKYDLMNVYEQKYIEDTYKVLLSNTNIIDNEDGSITIECLYKGDPKIAADMANFFFENLEIVSREISQERAAKFRLYMQSALDDAFSNLSVAEDSLNLFQKKFNVIDVEGQTTALIEQIAALEIQKINFELEREFLKSTHGDNHPDVKTRARNIEILLSKIASLKKSSDYSNIPLNDLPDVGMNFFRLYRDVQIRQTVVEFLVPQVEQAKIEEKKTVTDLVVLDRAVPFEKKAKPRRSLVCIALTSLGLLVSGGYFWLRDRHGLTREKLQELFPR
jgi:uncharacterized protein involved in exopolysaccharide biosynthesis